MVKKISYRGKAYPLRISYKALKGVVGELGREFESDSAVFDFEGAEALMYYGMKSGCEFAGQTFDLGREQMEDVIDEIGISGLIDAITAFTQGVQAKAKPGVRKK